MKTSLSWSGMMTSTRKGSEDVVEEGSLSKSEAKRLLMSTEYDHRESFEKGKKESGKKTFSMTSKQMTDIRNALEVIASDPATKSRVYRNMLDKFDTALKLMGPEVRANRTATRLLEDIESLVTKGEVCNFLDL